MFVASKPPATKQRRMQHVRPVAQSDVAQLKEVLNSIELFPSEMLDDLIFDYFNNPASQEIWFIATESDKSVAFGFCVPEELTVGTFNLKAIGVQSDLQGSGIGASMMAYLENRLKAGGHRILIVDTSSTPAFDKTRRFYEKLHYHKEAVIRDFWNEGDDKVMYWKKLV